ncbi:DUF3572 family protein [Microvirga sp. HBU67558]|uniref:DUF3572 family protein n=1 Tax=Microvirga TaxID=186650 RepID=UPI001B384B07|nr:MULTISPECIES: DUF3572 family protein [unclassified Microvirga]MBQ0820543.1 DUF3572 family protein [Microvirga sp. HBU67558]
MRNRSVFYPGPPLPRLNVAPVSDPGLDEVKATVARILDFIIADEERLHSFLRTSGFRPDADQAAAQLPLFMLTILDAVSKDQQLLSALARQQGITHEIVQMCQARLLFQVSVEIVQLSRQGDGSSEPT